MALRPQGAGAYYEHDDYDIAIREICRRADEPLREDMRLCHPGEPIYAPPRRGSSMLRALVVSLALTGCGWGLLKTHDSWRPWADDLWHVVSAAMDQTTAGATAGPDVAADGTTPPLDIPAEPLVTRDVVEAPGADTGEAVPHETAGSAAASSTETSGDGAITPADAAAADMSGENTGAASKAGAAEQAEVAPLPPPKADPTDPFQKRALAAGLHPELSRVLLTRMSDADFKNARLAIDKAIAETGDSDTLVWPKQRLPKLALFKVHFVAGAPADCRRYVVVVTKDGWSTTAQPMERCGVRRAQSSAS